MAVSTTITPLQANGFISSLPYVCRYVGGLVQGRMADALYARGLLSLLGVRRVFTAVCLGTPALTLILLSWPGCNSTYAVAMGRGFSGQCT